MGSLFLQPSSYVAMDQNAWMQQRPLHMVSGTILMLHEPKEPKKPESHVPSKCLARYVLSIAQYKKKSNRPEVKPRRLLFYEFIDVIIRTWMEFNVDFTYHANTRFWFGFIDQ